MKKTKFTDLQEKFQSSTAQTFTKRDLEDLSGLTDNTVYQTLKACGLDTSKTSYTRSEVEQYFIEARRILDIPGKGYKDVEEAMSSQTELTVQEESLKHLEGFREGLTVQVGLLVQDVLVDITKHLPRLAVKSLYEYSVTGNMDQSFNEFRQSVKRASFPSKEADFLTGKTAHLKLASALPEEEEEEQQDTDTP